MENPLSMLNKYRKAVDDGASFNGVFVEQEYYWLARLAKPGTTILDIGAKNGDTAIYFAMFSSVKRVIAYEPAPANWESLKKNVALNPFKGKIMLRNLAISSTRETKEISKTVFGQGYSFRYNQGSGGATIRSVTLNDALRGLRDVLIKCDCEGDEETLFDNADLSQVSAIEVEYHSCEDKVRRILHSKGYSTTVRRGENGIGMIYAKRRRSV